MSRERCVVSGPTVRLDRFLQQWLGEGFGRKRIAAMLAAGGVRVNARRARKGDRVREGDEITLTAIPDRPATLRPAAADLAIVYVDEHLVAVDKPPGMPSAGGVSSPSVAEVLLHTFPSMGKIDTLCDAGLVHRLDTATSGLLIAARDVEAHCRLRAQFTAKRVEKEYYAVVSGAVARGGTVDRPLRRGRGRRGRMQLSSQTARGWAAVTEYEPVESAGDLSLVRLRMRTGVTHQLRAHLAAIGHPVIGDRRYGAATSTRGEPDFPGHYLHARSMRFDDGELPSLATEFPAHWRPLFERLGWPTP